MLVEIDGIDGAGKTTQCIKLKEWSVTHGYNPIVVKEPGGQGFGSRIRDVIMSDEPRCELAEMFAFFSAKAQLYAQTILPHLESGGLVIADRGSLSCLSYNLVTTSLELQYLEHLLEVAMIGVRPDLVVLLDLPVDIAMKRVGNRLCKSRFDNKPRDFFLRQRDEFLRLVGGRPNCSVVDASFSVECIHDQICNLFCTAAS